MDDFVEAITEAKRSLDDYNGGPLAAIGVANAMANARNAAQTARKSLADGDQFTSEEATRCSESYTKMFLILLDTLQSAKDKAPLFKSMGVGPLAIYMVQNLHDEKNLFEGVAKTKIPDDVFYQMTPWTDKIGHAFDEAQQAYRT
ncbi:hypothetical protein N7447_004065 [Penicillium robsamsonii]|uniref:uncharacterized protein n=1 Tax=Penicillium robsamsonii TaxID=1792511 RepID=UPI002549A14C|nr:uncharacterized protein N7447_004065 [Penicillium robsamsonii]KAJ5827302.1 hypothetical protein N7447_004065 [Penicillium robsamsonii]